MSGQTVIPIERIASCIYLIRDRKVMLDYDLAELYDVPTKALTQAVSRNKNRAHGANCVKGSPDSFCQVGNAVS